MFLSFFWMALSYICVLLGVAFFTLFERKSLGYIQNRKGPNKVGLGGVIQPLADALKLFMKEENDLNNSNKFPYYLAPVFSFALGLSIWSLYWSEYSLWYFSLGLLFFLCVSSLNVYGVMMAGWSSNSKYSLLGSLRAVAQTISYEVTLFLVLLCVVSLSGSLNIQVIMECQGLLWNLFLMYPMALVWFVVCVAETNRAPFDFAEGESELVSGFNVEYGSGLFALLFLAEYMSIMFMSVITIVLFVGSEDNMMLSNIGFWVKCMLLIFLFIWVRGSYPRFRYDLLMKLTWLSFLPVSLMVLMWAFSVKFLIGMSEMGLLEDLLIWMSKCSDLLLLW
uniref:NADH-ubiquinone oxidoreductase chain 1 n=1 Tax=Nuttallina californica TaxID=413430 RepID=A0A0E3DEB8_9MOLL|nr:NADH dehydrogenase subunit 1 [Nuttallina californica]AIA77074.1 NADH dehydrogenase subunit 1 [Nuttallina californica]